MAMVIFFSVTSPLAGSTFTWATQAVQVGNVRSCELVWSYSLGSSRGVEATPVVVDGIMYQTASWSVVHAIDVRTGDKIWTFDPGVGSAICSKIDGERREKVVLEKPNVVSPTDA
jgi:glucose dehydrogenase